MKRNLIRVRARMSVRVGVRIRIGLVAHRRRRNLVRVRARMSVRVRIRIRVRASRPLQGAAPSFSIFRKVNGSNMALREALPFYDERHLLRLHG